MGIWGSLYRVAELLSLFFFLNDTATPEISPLPLHAALPISVTQPHIIFGQRSVIGGIVIWLCQTATNPAPASVTALTQTCPQSGNIPGPATAANVVAKIGRAHV